MKEIIDTLTTKDYVDFSQTYSSKNVINTVTGDEYIVDEATSKPIRDISTQKDKEQEVDNSSATIGYSNRSVKRTVTMKNFWRDQSKTGFLREEFMKPTYYLTIETDEIITDPNSVNLEIDFDYKTFSSYKEYFSNTSDDMVNEQNYNSLQSTYHKLWENYTGEETSAQDVLPYVHASMTNEDGSKYEIDREFPTNSYTKRVIKLNNGNYKIILSISCVTWWGYNEMKVGTQGNIFDPDLVLYDCYYKLMAATKLTFKVTATTISASEISFSYEKEVEVGGTKGRSYNLETNEFLQTTNEETTEEKKSKTLADTILNAYSIDRPIVSFTLLNCKKYKVDGVERFLRAEDLIYLKDEKDDFLRVESQVATKNTPAVFEVLKTRPTWDGAFSMEVVCQQLSTTTIDTTRTIDFNSETDTGDIISYQVDDGEAVEYYTFDFSPKHYQETLSNINSLKVAGRTSRALTPIAIIQNEECYKIIDLTNDINTADNLLDYIDRDSKITIEFK